MGTFHLKYDDRTKQAVKLLLRRKTNEVSAEWLIETLYELHKLRLLEYVPGGGWEETHYGESTHFQGKPTVGKLTDHYSYNYAKLAKELMRLLVAEFNITRFNFQYISEYTREVDKTKYIYQLDRWLEESPYPQKITLIGDFIQSRPFEGKLQNCLAVVDIEGNFLLDNFNRSKDIELPTKFIIKNFKVRNQNNQYISYKDVNEYRNREERLTRLAQQKKQRDSIKHANESGVLTFTDNYGIPLEVGCTVAYVNYSCRLGRVLKQDSKKIAIQEFTGDYVSKVYPHELVRIL